MPVTIKQGLMKYKNGQNEYIGINTVGETSSAQQISNINQAGTTQVSAINTKGQEVLASIPSDYTALSDEVGEVKDAIPYIFTDAMKTAILNLFDRVAYISDDGQDYIDALSAAFFPGLASISAVFTQPSGGILPSASLDSLKANLVVTAIMSDTSTHTVSSSDYVLSGTLAPGYSTITVAYGGKTTTFTCLVDYVLSSTFASDGSNNIDTGVKYSYSDYVSICCDVSISGFDGSTYGMLWGTYATGTNDYLAFYAWNTGSAYRLQGGGIASGDSFNLITGADHIRSVAVINTSTGAITNYFYNVTTETSATKSNTYSSGAVTSGGRNIYIGHPEEQYNYTKGIQGTINSFAVHFAQMSSDDIAAYLAGE